jgi:hypothetical protein
MRGEVYVREHFAGLLDVQRQYEQLTHVPGDGQRTPAKGGAR